MSSSKLAFINAKRSGSDSRDSSTVKSPAVVAPAALFNTATATAPSGSGANSQLPREQQTDTTDVVSALPCAKVPEPPSTAKSAISQLIHRIRQYAKVHRPMAIGWNDLDDCEFFLRKFDLIQEYGPCAGIARIQRWLRAYNKGKNPSRDVYDLLYLMSTSKAAQTQISQSTIWSRGSAGCDDDDDIDAIASAIQFSCWEDVIARHFDCGFEGNAGENTKSTTVGSPKRKRGGGGGGGATKRRK